MSHPDILVFMSDQHNARIAGFAGDNAVETPHLDQLARDGTAFEAAYTACPLCVPARCAMMSGQLPSKTGIFDNDGALPSDQATFAHSLGAAGYDVVLCGRMHFNGPDQRHGFTERLVGDIAVSYWGRGGAKRDDLGPYVQMPIAGDKPYGGGTSPGLEYDRAVIGAALERLNRQGDRPLCLVVGIFSPHHSLVAPEPLYRKYLERVPRPRSADAGDLSIHPKWAGRRRDFDPDLVHRLRAAYYGMVENLDSQIGEIREAWNAFAQTRGNEQAFVYVADHGEHAGERGLWGKMTFFEESVRIPMIWSGTGVQKGQCVAGAVSLMDLGPTLCELADAPVPPEQDGRSLMDELTGKQQEDGRVVVSELHREGAARMVRRGKWKYISFAGLESEDLLFDLENDPDERRNRIKEEPETARELRDILHHDWHPEMIDREVARRKAHQRILSAWGETVDVPEPDRWPIPESALTLPVQ